MKDKIYRQDAIDVKAEFLNEYVIRDTEAQTLSDRSYAKGWNECNCHWIDAIKSLPSAEPEIIYCKYCRKHNQGINEAPYLTDRCPLILHRGYAKGHEFDYQFCVYAERRTDEVQDNRRMESMVLH